MPDTKKLICRIIYGFLQELGQGEGFFVRIYFYLAGSVSQLTYPETSGLFISSKQQGQIFPYRDRVIQSILPLNFQFFSSLSFHPTPSCSFINKSNYGVLVTSSSNNRKHLVHRYHHFICKYSNFFRHLSILDSKFSFQGYL